MKIFTLILLFVLSTPSLFSFSFNGLHSGMMLEHVLEGNPLANKNFKSDSCSDTCRDLYYTEELLGAPAKIILHFTLSNKVLYKVEVLWSSAGIKEEDMQKFTDELTAYLDNKYGEMKVGIRPNYNEYVTFKEKKWQPEPNTEIVARKGLSSLTLILTDIELKSNHDFEMSQHMKEKNNE